MIARICLAGQRPMLMSLSRRSRQPEMMDQPGLATGTHSQALAGLARLNWLSRSSAILWPALRELAQRESGRTLRVLDVACGGGDVTIALAQQSRHENRRLEFFGCDMSDVALSVARRRAEQCGCPTEFYRAHVVEDELPPGFDALICSLFLHHLSDYDAEGLLRRMGAAAARLVLVNDLVRSRRGYLLAVAASRLLTRSRVVHVDGPLSVAGAFTPAEALQLAGRAGLAGATVARHWPSRFLLQWWKPGA